MELRYHGSPITDCATDSLDGTCTNIADCEHARHRDLPVHLDPAGAGPVQWLLVAAAGTAVVGAWRVAFRSKDGRERPLSRP